MERSWECEPGLGVAMSVALPTLPNPQTVGVYPLLVGSAVLDSVRELGLMKAELKWPNDVLVEERKLAGILCEVPQAPFVVAGIGINVFHSEEQLPNVEATSLHLEGIGVSDWRDLVSLILQRLQDDWARIPEIISRWNSHWETRLGTIGRRVTVSENLAPSWEGTAIGLDQKGHLKVRDTAHQKIRTLAVGDIKHLRH